MFDAYGLYHTNCRRCKVDVVLNSKSKIALCDDEGQGLSTTLLVSAKRTKHGDLWGGLVKVTWWCPECHQEHSDAKWTPDAQTRMPGF